MRIAICDDHQSELTELTNYIERYKSEKRLPFFIHTFLSPTELLATMEHTDYDILFLDMLMPGINGIETAREIRAYNKSVPIVFITSTAEFAVKSYSVKAFGYLIKPVNKEQIFTILDEIFQNEGKLFDGLLLKTVEGIAKVLFSEIVCVEVLGKKLFFHLSNGVVKETTTPLKTYEQDLLNRQEFLKVHRSFIINLFKMKELTKNSFVTYTGREIPIAHRLYKEVKETFVKSAFSDREELPCR